MVMSSDEEWELIADLVAPMTEWAPGRGLGVERPVVRDIVEDEARITLTRT